MSNVLILGGSGFIGKNIIASLQNDASFSNIINYSPSIKTDFSHLNIKSVSGTLKEVKKIKSLISDYQIDTVIHLVSRLIPSSTEKSFKQELKNVIIPTFELIDVLKTMNIRFVFFSSGGTIYGRTMGVSHEADPAEPVTLYGQSKLMIENYIRFRHRTNGLEYLILRPSNVYGKYQQVDRPQGFIAAAASRMLQKRPIEIWGNGSVVRDYIDVEDVAKAVKLLLLQNVSNKTLNVSSGEGSNLKEIIEILEWVLNKKADVSYKEKRNVDVEAIVLDNSEIKKYIHFILKPIHVGIENFISFLKIENAEK